MPEPMETPVIDESKDLGARSEPLGTEQAPTDPSIAGLPVELPAEAVRRLEAERDGAQDRYLRLAAEYDNFRKRAVRERDELTTRSQAALASRLLEVLDDMERLLAEEHSTAPAEALFQGMALVGKKLWKELEIAGLERIDPQGQPFDPTLHEAVATTPPEVPEQDHLVARTFQAGYRFKGALLRPARVQVFAEPGQG